MEEQIELGAPPGGPVDEHQIPPRAQRKLLKTLEQRLPLERRATRYRLYENGLLGVSRNDLGSDSDDEVVYQLGLLEGQPQQTWQIPYWLWGVGLIIVSMVAVAWWRGMGLHQWAPPLIPAALFLWVAFQGSYPVYEFRTATSKIVLLRLNPADPDRTYMSRFNGQLLLAIEHAKPERAAWAVAEHRRLCKEGVISEKQYERAKARLLELCGDQEEFKAAGALG